jgi:hypothetical protein
VPGLDHPLIGDTRARKVALLAQQTPELETRSGLVVGLLGAHRLIVGALRACVTLLGQQDFEVSDGVHGEAIG